MKPRYTLTDDQLKVRNEVADHLERTLLEARETLSAQGVTFDDTGGAYCFHCDCEAWKASNPPNIARCARPTCRHGFVHHNVF